MKNDFQSRSTSAAADQAAGQSASDLQPLGVTAQAGATVSIYAELPSDATAYVVPTQFYGESGVWKGTPVALENGRNYITVQQIGSLGGRGGPLYITYSGSHPEQIKLQVRVVNNAWEMPVLELSSWYSMGESARQDAIRTYVQELSSYVAALPTSGLNTNVRNATEIFTPSVLLSLPADQVLSGLKSAGSDEDAMVNAMYQNVLAWEEELFIANKVQGIIDFNATLTSYQYPMTTRQNIRYMRMFAGAFMYAAGNHIGVEYGSTSALVQGKPTSATGKGNANGLFGWGIAHEIGHNMDKLGNLGSEAKSNEVRVAYDKTISSDLYDLSRQDGTITITMKNGASVPVTGIKVTGTGLSGSYTVKVKANAGADWTTAKTGTLSDDTVVAYFTKPGTAESDTRIWTYDAAVLEITGIPEDATVQLLDYPGDRVDFYEGATVGVLKDDYKYGDGEDDVIKKGTLVILGTYRGDPAYNYVSVEAVYNTTSEAAEANGVTDDYPLEIRAVFYRTDDPNNAESKRVTSETLWISFPGEDDVLLIDLKRDLSELN